MRFSAYSLKNLITQRLSEDSKFTDQVYEGSNLTILIDLVAYLYQCLVYQLNNAASESMFSDTQIYSNINRLVNLIGYNPKGCTSAQFPMLVYSQGDTRGKVIPMFSSIDTGKVDGQGKKILFSTANTYRLDSDETQTIQLYNGYWQLYPTIFTASGTEREKFVLDRIGSDSASGEYVSDNLVVFIDYADPKAGERRFEQWKSDPNGIFLNYTNDSQVYGNNTISFYDETAKVYSVRLNQDKRYEIQFGDGITGRILQPGDRIYVFYLTTNGPYGNIDVADLNLDGMKINLARNTDFGLQSERFYEIFDFSEESLIQNEDYELGLKTQTIQKFSQEEGVEDIRDNAPKWLRMGNRLITRRDYEYFVKNVKYVKDQLDKTVDPIKVVDVKCMNNVEYVSKFYKWLYLNGRDFHGDGRYYFDNMQFWNVSGYRVNDPADANNTYLIIKDQSEDGYQDTYDRDGVERAINRALNPVKTMTTEIRVVKPVIVRFELCANPDKDYVKSVYIDGQNTFDEGVDSYIEVTASDDAIYTNSNIQKQVHDAIVRFFSIERFRIGSVVNINNLLQEIYDIPSVNRVRTVFVNPFDGSVTRVNGLSFATWSPVLQPLDQTQVGYDDLDIGNGNRSMEDFQFPLFTGASGLMDRIRVITKATSSINITRE